MDEDIHEPVSSSTGIRDKSRWKSFGSRWVNSLFLLVVGVWLILLIPPASRIGDGCEYMLMTMAWAEQGQPFANAEVMRIYEEFSYSQDASYVSMEVLQPAFEKLTLDGQMDFPHFWFYSLLAVPFYLILKLVGGDVAHCFTFLNIALLGLTVSVAQRQFGKRAVAVIAALCFLSPALWFINKGHTEFFTVTVGTIGVMYLMKKQYAISFLFMALLSTQNPPFAIVGILIAGVAFCFDRRQLLQSWPALLAGCLIVSLHPLYYFARFGQVTPQLITGAASSGFKGWKELTCFVIDPDVGLISNCPWVVVPLIAVMFYAIWWKQKLNWPALGLILGSILILCWAQAKTNNFNHGGTIKVSRYALWYLPFLFPLLLQFYNNYQRVSVWQRAAVWGFLIVAVYFNSVKYWPQRGESYLFQASLAEKFYDHFPAAYDPVPEIFIERNVRKELPTLEWAVSNRSGTKIVIHSGRLKRQLNRRRKQKPLDPVGGMETNVDPDKLVDKLSKMANLPDDDSWFFIDDAAGSLQRSNDSRQEVQAVRKPDPVLLR